MVPLTRIANFLFTAMLPQLGVAEALVDVELKVVVVLLLSELDVVLEHG